MALTATRRSGLVDQVIEQMRLAIRTGEWAVDQRIPPEPELVGALGVGRNTVREAVRALAHAGLLEVRQGDGTFVRATSEISGALRRLCGTELREVRQVRLLLEVEAARLAATNRTDADLATLAATLAERDQAVADERWAEAVDADARFHREVVSCAGNSLLTELYLGMTEVIRASLAATAGHDDPAWRIGHGALLAAISDRHADRAATEAGRFLAEHLTG
ncbi:MAG TPA: FCD domain-containing protein [Pseudonocardiaceae bacterium]|jgi:DNA-binding FadR family transcriptional regulator|nr:FCD domain-containing protein [Pseudonocardiaceae bacterium]